MNKLNRKRFWKFLWIIFYAYSLLGVIFYFMQDMLIFRPKKLKEDYQYKFDIPFQQVDLAVTEKKNLSIVQFTVPDSIRKGIVLYFHGNHGNINRYAVHASSFTKNGYEVWMMDYPGFGKSTGKRSESILYADALLFYKMAISKEPIERIILYGRSLGSGIAAQLASIRGCRELVLETPYYSMDALAKHYFFIYPVKLFGKYEIPTYRYLEDISAPVTIFHGTKDGIIPFAHTNRLKEKFPKINLVRIEKGRHNNLSTFRQYHEKLDSILKN